MKNFDIQTLYKLLFADYPDIVTVRQLQVMLGISRHAAYVENGVQPAARAAGS